MNFIFIYSFLLSTFLPCIYARYEPNWLSIDSRPLPSWYDDYKIGIFLHWGVYSVPGLGEWFLEHWREHNQDAVEYMKKNYPPNFTYDDFASDFKADLFNPKEWAEIFRNSGAKYVVLTSKHHEGYTMWPSTYSFNWNVVDVGPNRDLLGDLALAVRDAGLKFGAYYSLFEWYNPLYLRDKKNNFSTNEYVRTKMYPELMELVSNYKPEVIWSDGDWEANDTYFSSLSFLTWLYNESPVKDTVVTNDRWGKGTSCKHGGYYSCQDRYNPGTLQLHKWENAMTLDKDSWGFRRTASLKDYITIESLLGTLASTISCGGNLLVNIGPTSYGKIPAIGEERLQQMGSWLHTNGEAVYGSTPWIFQNDTKSSDVWYTMKRKADDCTVYAFVLKWPKDNVLSLESPIAQDETFVSVLGYDRNLEFEWNTSRPGVAVHFPDAALVGKWAWVLKFSKLNNGCPNAADELSEVKSTYSQTVPKVNLI